MNDRDKVIKGLLCIKGDYIPCASCKYADADGYGRGDRCKRQCASDAIALLKEKEPKRPVHVHQEFEKHDWVLDKDGEVDEFAFEYDLCYGPHCKRCNFSFCVHCWPDGWNQPCVIDKDVCPNCKEQVWKAMKFCSDCGQELNWE